MKKNYFLLAGFISAIFISVFTGTMSVNAQSPTYTWAKNIGSTGADWGNSMVVDGSGNVYITGYFNATADFDPGAGTANLISAGSADIFFAKYDALGDYVWAKNIGSTGSDYGYGIAVDGSGNVYITGYFNGTADFDPGAGTATLMSSGNSDIYFAKYDATGAYIWAKKIGSTTADIGYSIAVDGSSNVYITGNFNSTADFDPGAGTATLISTGSTDVFFAKYDALGAYLWAKKIGSTTGDISYSIKVDGSSNIYITGYFTGTAVDFDPGAGTANLISAGSYDIFFAKYDASGAYVWAANIGSTSVDYGNSIFVDGSGNVYITGKFMGTADFDPGAGTANLSSLGGTDTYFAKYDASGAYIWAKLIASGSSSGNGIAVDGSGNVYVTGMFTTVADFDPGAGTAVINLTGSFSDIFLAKYNASGAYLWAVNIGSTTAADVGTSMAVDGSGNVYITGYFNGTADFDPGAGTANLIAAGTSDIFFAKYSGTVIGVQQSSFATSDIIVYPTVSSGVFRLSMSFPFREGMVEVYSVIGEKIYEAPTLSGETLPLHSLEQAQIIDLSFQPDGIYFVRVKTEKGISTQKLIIQ